MDVHGDILEDRETGALGHSVGDEKKAMLAVLAENKTKRGAEIDGADYEEIRRAVDGVVYDQGYLERSEESLRLVLDIVRDRELTLKSGLQEVLADIQSILDGGNKEEIERLIGSIQQIRLFDARHKDISKDEITTHPINIDIKFKPQEDNEWNRKTIRWRANENTDETMMRAIDEIKARYAESGKEPGQLRRYIIAYQWLPEGLTRELQQKLELDEVTAEARNAMADLFGVKLDVRYDVIHTPNGGKVMVVSREAEVNGDDNEQVNWHLGQIQEALQEEGHATFVPKDFDFGTLALSEDPEAMVRDTLAAKLPAECVAEAVEAMRQQVADMVEKFGDGQIVVDLPKKASVIKNLTTAGDLEGLREAVAS